MSEQPCFSYCEKQGCYCFIVHTNMIIKGRISQNRLSFIKKANFPFHLGNRLYKSVFFFAVPLLGARPEYHLALWLIRTLS